MERKRGDEVQIKSMEWFDGLERNEDEEIYYPSSNTYFSPEMKRYAGKKAIIVLSGDGYYDLDIDGGAWAWDEWMLETTGRKADNNPFSLFGTMAERETPDGTTEVIP